MDPMGYTSPKVSSLAHHLMFPSPSKPKPPPKPLLTPLHDRPAKLWHAACRLGKSRGCLKSKHKFYIFVCTSNSFSVKPNRSSLDTVLSTAKKYIQDDGLERSWLCYGYLSVNLGETSTSLLHLSMVMAQDSGVKGGPFSFPIGKSIFWALFCAFFMLCLANFGMGPLFLGPQHPVVLPSTGLSPRRNAQLCDALAQPKPRWETSISRCEETI